MTGYPRDLHGYGEKPPHPDWPGAAKIAVQFVVNYEEGGERSILHGDGESEAFLSEIVGAEPWAGQRHANMESIYEYGARAGFWRLHRIFTRAGIPVTVFAVATALARSPAQVEAMQAADWEIACHGLKWVEHRDMPPEDELAAMRAAVDLHTEVVGAPPRGWYTGRSSAATLRLAAGMGQFDYLADSYADDLPYWLENERRPQLVVPYTLDSNDMRFATTQGFNSGDQFFTYLRDAFDVLYAEGHAGAPRMLSVGLHCRLAGRPGRVRALERFIAHVTSHPDVWCARRIDIAEHWAARHPPIETGVRPSQMDRETFVARFGEVIEGAAWIAEAAFDLERGPAHDTAVGMHSVLVRVFRRADEAARLAILNDHPDLAGKLAQAKRLTAASTAEQAAVGLDALTDDERATFEDLNRRYVARHGFPFIIAVRDHDKHGILAAMHRRIENDRSEEFAEACRQVERIARLRLEALLP